MPAAQQVVPYVDNIPTWVEVGSAALGALSGALLAVRIRFDLSGLLMLSVVMGLGGGMIRDTLLQDGTPVALTSPLLLPTAIGTGMVVFFFSETLNTAHRRGAGLLIVVDAAFLGVFSIVGTAKGLGAGLPAASCVLLGVLAGLGGGMLRDILINEQPELLRPGTIVGLAALIGCSIQVFLVRGLGTSNSVGVVPMAVIVGLRFLAIWRGWESPMPTDMVQQARQLRLPPEVVHQAKKLRHPRKRRRPRDTTPPGPPGPPTPPASPPTPP